MLKRKNTYEWAKGDLVKVTRGHPVCKADPDGVWPDVFLKNNDCTVEIPHGAVIIAFDDMPLSGQRAVVRVLYDDSIWVANSNYLTIVYLENRISE